MAWSTQFDADVIYLDQARAGHKPVRALFLSIASVRERLYVCLCVCVSAPEAMNN